MSKKKALPSIRFEIKIEGGKTYYVYATTPDKAWSRFFMKHPMVPAEKITVKEDKGEWKTSLQDGRAAPGA